MHFFKKTLSLLFAGIFLLSSLGCGPKAVSVAEQAPAASAAETFPPRETEEAVPVMTDPPEESAPTAEPIPVVLPADEPAMDTEPDPASEKDPFSLWNGDAPSLGALKDYVALVTEESSMTFIPPADRIAVFDFDGALYGERLPAPSDFLLFQWRVMEDPGFSPDTDMIVLARDIAKSEKTGEFSSSLWERLAKQSARAYAGMTLEEFRAYAEAFLLREAEDFEGLAIRDAFYLPMLEALEYLEANGFTVYVCTDGDRFLCETLLKNVSDIPLDRIIGTEVRLETPAQGDGSDDTAAMVRTGELLGQGAKTDKGARIERKIGQKPVLVFGNSSDDETVCALTAEDNPYVGAAFLLAADDDERDAGDVKKAASLREKWEGDGWNVISVKNDFLTVYGEKAVKKAAEDSSSTLDSVETLALWRAYHGSKADAASETLLASLEASDPDAGARWRSIMELWTSLKERVHVNGKTLPDNLPDTDELCIVALGYQLKSDGSMKKQLKERLKIVLKAAKQYPNAYIVCTGGGTASKNKKATEAKKMADWLKKKGVDSRRIIIEDKSHTTAQNAMYTYDLLTRQYPGISKLVIVTSDYHVRTGTLLFEAEAILRAPSGGEPKLTVISNASSKTSSDEISSRTQAGGLIELAGDFDTAVKLYHQKFSKSSVPPLP